MGNLKPKGVSEAKFEEDSLSCFIYHSFKPLFKVLLTNCCYKKCNYCANNLKSNLPRYLFSPLSLAKKFISLYKKGKVKGIFISNSIYKTPNFSQEKILETVYILRKKMGYQGYIHAKVMPEADFELIKKLFDFADRISINLELPAQKYLSSLCDKNLGSLLKTLKFLAEFNQQKRLKRGITTQFMVGGCQESDRELLTFSEYLYKNLRLRKVYYSGFEPMPYTPLENLSPVNPLRVKRLYEADYLLRDYGFKAKDFVYDLKGNLIIEEEVKEAYANKQKDIFPVNVNQADYFELLRIPGIGKKSAVKIINLRKNNRIKELAQLQRIGLHLKVKKWICF